MLEQEVNTRNKAFLYNDKKIFGWVVKTINLRHLSLHTLFSIGLYEVRDGSEEITMSDLLKNAEECSVDEEFIKWIEEYTPYKYSAKKRRIMQNDKKIWNINSAFLNPFFGNKSLLHDELKKLPETRQEADKYEFFDLGILLDQLIKDLDRYRNLIDNRKKSNNDKGFYQQEPHSFNEYSSKKKTKNKKVSRKKNKSKNCPLQKEGGNFFGANDPSTVDKKLVGIDKTQDLIKNYLMNNPLPERFGPLGMPQSKYRYGTYGIKSMEYDAWSRWKKK